MLLTSGNCIRIRMIHDDAIKWKKNPRYWPFVRGIHRSPVNSGVLSSCKCCPFEKIFVTGYFFVLFFFSKGWHHVHEVTKFVILTISGAASGQKRKRLSKSHFLWNKNFRSVQWRKRCQTVDILVTICCPICNYTNLGISYWVILYCSLMGDSRPSTRLEIPYLTSSNVGWSCHQSQTGAIMT